MNLNFISLHFFDFFKNPHQHNDIYNKARALLQKKSTSIYFMLPLFYLHANLEILILIDALFQIKRRLSNFLEHALMVKTISKLLTPKRHLSKSELTIKERARKTYATSSCLNSYMIFYLIAPRISIPDISMKVKRK